MVLPVHQKDYLKVCTTLLEALTRLESVDFTFSFNNLDNDKRPDSVTLSLDSKENDLDNKHSDSVEIKQERLNDASLCPDEDLHSLSTTQPSLKKLRADVADTESNIKSSGGKLKLFYSLQTVTGVEGKIDK